MQLIAAIWTFSLASSLNGLRVATGFSFIGTSVHSNPPSHSQHRSNEQKSGFHLSSTRSSSFNTPNKIVTPKIMSDSNNNNVRVFTSPFLLLEDPPEQAKRRTALVILNSPIQNPPSPLFQKLWSSSFIKICADGGANRLYKANPELIPDLVRGDLDSLQDDVRKFYEAKGVQIERDPNQDNNDLDKALSALKVEDNNSSSLQVVVYGGFGGRFDQEMASMQALFIWSEHFQHNILIVDDNTSAFLIPAGMRYEIRLPRYGTSPDMSVLGEGPTCGLIPLGCPCERVVTTGFRWNLDGSVPLQFGGLVSTSNYVEEELVTIETSHPLIFTTEIVSGMDTF